VEIFKIFGESDKIFVFQIVFTIICYAMYCIYSIGNDYTVVKRQNNIKNVVVILNSISIIVICTYSFIIYFMYYKHVNDISNYTFLSIIFFGISISFSLFEWLLYSIDQNHFIINSQYFERVKTESDKVANIEKEKINDKIKINEKLSLILNDVICFRELIKLEQFVNKEVLLSYVNNNKTLYSDFEYSILKTNLEKLNFVIHNCNLYAGGKFPNKRTFYYFINDNVVYELQVGRLSDSFLMDSSEMKCTALKVEILSDRKLLNSKLKEIDELNNKIVIPFFDFVYNNLFELVSIRQGYFMPKSGNAKFIHLIFGLYKYLMLGAFINLLLK
jgi:hypothetical protein